MPKQNTLDLLQRAKDALYDAELAIRLEEDAPVNQPMYRMRLQLAEVTNLYAAGVKVCGAVTGQEVLTAKMLRHIMPNVV